MAIIYCGCAGGVATSGARRVLCERVCLEREEYKMGNITVDGYYQVIVAYLSILKSIIGD